MGCSRRHSPWFVAGATASDLEALTLLTDDGPVDAPVYPDKDFFVVFQQTGSAVTGLSARFADGKSVDCGLTVNLGEVAITCDG